MAGFDELTILAVAALTLTLAPVAAQAQRPAVLTGIVRAQSGAPLPGARIRFAAEPARETNAAGRFRLEVPAGRSGTLELAAVGFSPERVAIPELAAGQVQEIAATLRPLYLLEPLTIAARRERPLLDTKDATTGGSVEALG